MASQSRRNFIARQGALAACAALAPALLRAQPAWPTKPLHLIATFAPGGVIDSTSRLIGEYLAPLIGQPVIVENRPGSAGNIGAAFVAKSEPDGQTMVVVLEGTIVINPHVYASMPLDPLKDLAPAGKIGNSTIVFVANPAIGVKTLQEAVALSRKTPGGLAYSTAGAMTITHIAGELMTQQTGANFLHVPYKGGGPAVADVLAGHVPLAFVSATSVEQHIRAGRLIGLGVPSGQRSPTLPGVPTFIESGLPGFEITSWAGIFAPAGTPVAVLDKFNAELNAVLAKPEVVSKLAVAGIAATPISLARFTADIQRELAWYGPLLKKAGIKASDS